MLLLLVLAQSCVSWPIGADWGFSRGGVKETGAKTAFQTEGEHSAAALDSIENCCVLRVLKPFLVEYIKLKMSIMCLLLTDWISIKQHRSESTKWAPGMVYTPEHQSITGLNVKTKRTINKSVVTNTVHWVFIFQHDLTKTAQSCCCQWVWIKRVKTFY